MVTTNRFDYREALSRLHGPSDGMTVRERCQLARQLAEDLAAGGMDEHTDALAKELATDPKWEVRAAIAEVLVRGPAEIVVSLARDLLDDPNSYVRRAAKRATEVRCRLGKEIERVTRTADHVERHLERVTAQFGKSMAEKVRRSCEHYGSLLAGSIAHDLRSILTHLKGNYYMLIEDARVKGVPERKLRRVEDDIEFLERTVRDLTVFTNPMSPERCRERIAEVIQQAAAMAQECIRKSGFDPDTVGLAVEAPALSVPMCRRLIVLALVNIIKNAYESFVTSERRLKGGEIRIAAKAISGEVVITIADNGIGMIKGEVLGRSLFVPGRRNKSKRFSTGYGLPVAQRNVYAHGGSLAIDSCENKGTTVTITLPLETEDNHDTRIDRRRR